MNHCRSIMFLSFFILRCLDLSGQGAWIIPNVNPEYPRVICSRDSVEEIIKNLSKEPQRGVYSNVYDAARVAIPAGNSIDTDRRTRASQCKNAAFCYLLGKKIIGTATQDIPNAEKDSLLSLALVLLADMNVQVDTISITNLKAIDSWQWRSNEIINYSLAYDCMKGAGVPDSVLLMGRLRLQRFTGNLFKASNKVILGHSFWTVFKNNFSFIVCGALGTSAVVLSQYGNSDLDCQPRSWLYCALARTDSLLWFDANHKSIKGKISGYAESPYYFLYAWQHLAPFFRGLNNYVNSNYIFTDYAGNKKNILQPLRDPDYDKLFDWLYLIRMPDGRVPAVDDTYIDVFNSTLTLTGKAKYFTQNYFSKLSPLQCNSFNCSLMGADDYRVNFLGLNLSAYNTDFNETPSQFLTDAGSIVFRSGWDSMANYMHLTAESGLPRAEAGGHNQADEMSFILESHGQLLALDAGYVQYDQREKVCQANNHNMLLVDETGTDCGFPGNSGGTDVTITNSFMRPAFEFTELHTSYQNASVKRCAMMVDKKYFILLDKASRITPAKFTWQLHGYGSENGNDTLGYYTGNTQKGIATWRKNNVSLQANIVAKDAAIVFRAKNSLHELTYMKTENHTALLAEVSNKQAVTFGSVLYPYEKLNDTITNDTNLIEIKKGSRTAFFAIGKENKTQFTGDAEAVFSQFQNDSLATVFAYRTTFIKRHSIDSGPGDPHYFYALSSSQCNLFCENPLTGDITLHVNNANTILLTTHYVPQSVTGPGLLSWKMRKPENLLEIVTSGEATIQIHCNSERNFMMGVAIPKRDIDRLLIYPVPASSFIKIKSELAVNKVNIYSYNGSLVFTGNSTYIEIDALASGIYGVEVIFFDGRRISRKLMKY